MKLKSVSQYEIIAVVGKKPGLTASEIADEMRLVTLSDRESATKRIAELCKRQTLRLFRRAVAANKWDFVYYLR